jgi:hypothetical protein
MAVVDVGSGDSADTVDDGVVFTILDCDSSV